MPHGELEKRTYEDGDLRIWRCATYAYKSVRVIHQPTGLCGAAFADGGDSETLDALEETARDRLARKLVERDAGRATKTA